MGGYVGAAAPNPAKGLRPLTPCSLRGGFKQARSAMGSLRDNVPQLGLGDGVPNVLIVTPRLRSRSRQACPDKLALLPRR